MVLDDTILLFGLVIKQLSTCNLATTHKPTILGKIAKNKRFASTFRCQFYDIKPGFHKNEQST